MGRYMRKAKLSEDVAVMEVSQSLGVRTRAKTLALQRLQSSSNVPDSSCYLQLRSRRLVKASAMKSEGGKISSPEGNWQQESEKRCGPRSGSRLRVADSVNSGSGDSGSISGGSKEERCFESGCDLGVEASFGENNLDFEPRERSTRESTPCSLIRDPGAAVATPGSSTRRRPTVSIAVDRRNGNAVNRNAPSTAEIEEFFAHSEQQQQRQFIDKYNFDISNDVPLPGRYEWVRVNQ